MPNFEYQCSLGHKTEVINEKHDAPTEHPCPHHDCSCTTHRITSVISRVVFVQCINREPI